jgi:hypothetical protein
MGIGDKNSELDMVLDIRTNLLRLVIDMRHGTVKLSSPEDSWGAPSAVCRFKRGWCG